MSDNSVEKHHGPLDSIKEVTGIYGLGFESESFKGFMLPFIIVLVVGGLGGLLIWRWL
jgi:hypothetical protein